MTADQELSAIKESLKTALAQTLQDLQVAGQSAQTVMLDQSAVGRVSRGDALQQQEMAKARERRLDLRRRKLEAALNRVALGQYGFCCQCEAEIDAARLASDPAAVFCLDCLDERSR